MTESAAAQCPGCGYFTVHLLEGERLMCTRSACGYEHLLTRPIPIVKPIDPKS